MSDLPVSKKQRLKLDLKAAHIALREVSKHDEGETQRAHVAEEMIRSYRDHLRLALLQLEDSQKRIGQLENMEPSDTPFKLTVDLKDNVHRVYHNVTSWEEFSDRLLIKRGDKIIDEVGEFEGLSTG